MRPKPAAGQRPAPRGNCLPQFPVCCGTTNVTVERLWFPLTSRVVPCRARCLPRRSLAEPGPNRPNCRNCPKSSRYFPVGSRSYLARPLAVGTAAGKSMGLCAPYPQQVRDLHHAEIAHRNFPYAVGPPVERWNGEGFPGVSRSFLARPLSDGTAAGKSMGLCAPYPQQVKDLHHAENADRIFPYAVGPPVLRWNGCGFLP